MLRLFSQRRRANEQTGFRLPHGVAHPALFAVNSGVALQGRRLVTRVVLAQTCGAALVACAFWVWSGGPAAVAAMAGGLIVAIGSVVLGWRMFAPGVASAEVLRRAMYSGEGLKWLWYVIAMVAAFARFKLAALPLMTGLVAAHGCYWIGLVGLKRGN
jgi:F0F1-type ATP synthase assembly protein I